jgi:hypothetical protein
VTSAARALALLVWMSAGPWFVWSAFEAIELQRAIDAAQVEARR